MQLLEPIIITLKCDLGRFWVFPSYLLYRRQNVFSQANDGGRKVLEYLPDAVILELYTKIKQRFFRNLKKKKRLGAWKYFPISR